MPLVATGSGLPPREAASGDRQAAYLQFTSEWNRLLRRFRSYANEAEWISALHQGLFRLAAESAIFVVEQRTLCLRAQNGLNCPRDLSIGLSTAHAFAAAIESKDSVVALRTPTEVGEALSTGNRGARAHIVPIANGSRVAALLFAAGPNVAGADAVDIDMDGVDINGLELLANFASLALERKGNDSLHTQLAAAPSVSSTAAPTPKPAPERKLAAWANLTTEQRTLHSRAQRLARVKVAEMELARPESCRAGRREGNFYLFLKREIDAARDSYRKQFMMAPGMVDYLHLEIVGAALGGDEQKLGADYPGQLD
jgi:hypothetical protein